jgi:hypothetical protein
VSLAVALVVAVLDNPARLEALADRRLPSGTGAVEAGHGDHDGAGTDEP